jgi:hypothetical protein
MNDELRAKSQAGPNDPLSLQTADRPQSLASCLLFHKNYSKNSYIKSLALKIQLSLASIPQTP